MPCWAACICSVLGPMRSTVPRTMSAQVAAALLELGVEHLWTGHCTGPAAFALLKEELGDRVEPLTGGMRLGI